jgi:hypothetical protein
VPADGNGEERSRRSLRSPRGHYLGHQMKEIHGYDPSARDNDVDKPPQGNDVKCGFGCHTIVKTRDYVFTDYGNR